MGGEVCYDTYIDVEEGFTAKTTGKAVLYHNRLSFWATWYHRMTGSINDADHLSNQAELQLPENGLTERESLANDLVREEDQLVNEETGSDGFNPNESFAKRGRDGGINYKNRQYLNYKPGMNHMPPGLNTPMAQEILQEIRNTGANISWDNTAQMYCFNRDALGQTYNANKDIVAAGMIPSSEYISVNLSPDATATVVYEEYLHVMEAQARGWMPTPTEEANLEEEIRVEYQVMQNAQRLGTTLEEWQTLSRNRQKYIDDLNNKLGGLLPDSLKPYLKDPSKPATIP